MRENIIVFKGKKIRDAVHGDIFLPNKFLKIIDTKEFQRLRRIHQLATANMVFPGAEHTRYSHSLGTYYIMKKIIEHFKKHFDEMNLKIDSDEENIALVAALLHDIGHGPFSHAFEGISKIDHEKWTIKIITSDNTDVNKVLKQEFGEDFPEKVAKLISKGVFKEKSICETPEVKIKRGSVDLTFILQSLVSSQIDADRMDYLMRDAFYTGVPFGYIDIERLISSMSIVVKEEQFYVGILEKYLSDLEHYLLARYQMHSEVYFDELKCQMELIIKKILERAKRLYLNKKLSDNNIPRSIIKLFKEEDLEIHEYIKLDDSILLNLFSLWKDNKDKILSELCCCLLDRKKYIKLRLLNNSEEDINKFKEGLKSILKEHNYYVKSFEDEYFWIENKVKFDTYKNNKDNIFILRSNGLVEDLANVSQVIKKDKNSLNMNFVGKRNMAFINFNLLEDFKEVNNVDELKKQIRDLIYMYDNRNHIEIEKKYLVKDRSVFSEVINKIKEYNKIEIEKKPCKEQEDYYYDTKSRILYENNNTLRIRKKGERYCLTIKIPAKSSGNNSLVDSERFEYEKIGDSKDINEYKEFILHYLKDLINEKNFKSLKNNLIVKNNREIINLEQKNVKLEVAFDDVEYNNNSGQKCKDYEIEIELKSDYPHKANLKLLCNYLEDKVEGLNATIDSKYKRGIEMAYKNNDL